MAKKTFLLCSIFCILFLAPLEVVFAQDISDMQYPRNEEFYIDNVVVKPGQWEFARMGSTSTENLKFKVEKKVEVKVIDKKFVKFIPDNTSDEPQHWVYKAAATTTYRMIPSGNSVDAPPSGWKTVRFVKKKVQKHVEWTTRTEPKVHDAAIANRQQEELWKIVK